MQFKTIHNIVATNKRKKDWGIEQSDICSFCNDIDTLDHALWDCTFTQTVLIKCLSMLNLTLPDIQKHNFILGYNDLSKDNVLLIIKNYLLYLRLNGKKYNATQFVKEIEIHWLTDTKYMRHDVLDIKWSSIQHLKRNEIWTNMLT